MPAADWDRCAGMASPFSCHAYFAALEDSGSATAQTGWRPAHLVAMDADAAIVGLMPAWLKAHSYGEYVFDQGWADAWQHAGGRYYPKLQIATPFTPANAPKLLASAPDVRSALIAGAVAMVERNGLSSAHATFLNAGDADDFAAAGWLLRHDIQFHWLNRGYRDFEDFLADLPSRKRKILRRERAAALAAVDEVVWLTGAALDQQAWDSFWTFYQDTGSRKWGRPYLTRPFFDRVAQQMGERILLVLARRNGRNVAGALNFIGDDTLFGRQWGAIEDIPFLHFELCYHQAIDIACRRGLARVEAGAQGEHKLARGYRPALTTSAHYLPDAGFRAAVADFLARETPLVQQRRAALEQLLPFRADSAPGQP